MKALRMCVVCGRKFFKWSLIRLTVTQTGSIEIDARQRLPGRGAYICPGSRCIQRLGSRRELDRAFRRKIDTLFYAKIQSELEMVVRSSKVESLVGLARRAGKVAAGTAAVEEALLKKKARLVIVAEDVSPNTDSQFVRLAETGGVSILKIGTKSSWGALFRRKELGVLAILDSNFARGILRVKE